MCKGDELTICQFISLFTIVCQQYFAVISFTLQSQQKIKCHGSNLLDYHRGVDFVILHVKWKKERSGRQNRKMVGPYGKFDYCTKR